MRKRTFTIEQIIQILAEGEKSNNTVASVCRKYGIAQGTYYRWNREYRDFSIPTAKKLKMLEEENRSLRNCLQKETLRTTH